MDNAALHGWLQYAAPAASTMSGATIEIVGSGQQRPIRADGHFTRNHAEHTFTPWRSCACPVKCNFWRVDANLIAHISSDNNLKY